MQKMIKTHFGKVEVRTYPCFKFGSYDHIELTKDQKETLRGRRINLVLRDETGRGMIWRPQVITKKGQWGTEIMNQILWEVQDKNGEFDNPYSETTKKGMEMVWEKVQEHNKIMLGLMKPKMMRDPKTGKFMKATS